MTIIFYAVLNVLALYFFIKKKKNLHILEILVYWMISSYLFQNFSALCYMNFKTIIIPDQLSYAFAHFINRIVLIPLLMVTFLHFFLTTSSNLKKLLLMIIFIILFSGLEWLADFLGVFKHVHWQLWWSFSFWFACLLVLIGFMKFFRKILFKGGFYV
ncbi:hypothetical protein ACIFOT_19310 [Neobacillus sp. NRS-1170]|uniref:hypothetical protein n=1 Tax=Neobacillus sp. NRS-1170 TaxID=3233898 RepID=UPI003D2DA3AB